MAVETLTNENFVLFAAKHYRNSDCVSDEEFYTDLKRIKYIKRLFRKYEESGLLQERLILNHVIILYNMFGSAATKMLFFKLAGHYSQLKPFLELLGHMPDRIVIGNPSKIINTSDIPNNEEIAARLRDI